jgi:hypothetical protein
MEIQMAYEIRVPDMQSATNCEVAIEILNDLIGYAADQIDQEQQKAHPDQDIIDLWRGRRDEWVQRRRCLVVTDTASIRSILDKDGAILRSLRQG